jgi:hypothetical protein
VLSGRAKKAQDPAQKKTATVHNAVAAFTDARAEDNSRTPRPQRCCPTFCRFSSTRAYHVNGKHIAK